MQVTGCIYCACDGVYCGYDTGDKVYCVLCADDGV